MDLLVYLVRKRELDVTYISISALASDFLDYIGRLEVPPSLDQIGDFILLAATLLEFKANELLAGPEPEITEAEMQKALREHSLADLLALRTQVERLAELEEHQVNLFDRGTLRIEGLEAELSSEMLTDVSIYDIAVAFRDLIQRVPEVPVHLVDRIPYTLEGQMAFITAFFGGRSRIAFAELGEALPSRVAVVMTFLAMLELLRLGRIAVRQAEAFGPLVLILKEAKRKERGE